MTWTQAICWRCWIEQRGPPPEDREQTEDGPRERCSYCGEDTCSGIYVRDDPATVPYPREEAAGG